MRLVVILCFKPPMCRASTKSAALTNSLRQQPCGVVADAWGSEVVVLFAAVHQAR